MSQIPIHSQSPEVEHEQKVYYTQDGFMDLPITVETINTTKKSPVRKLIIVSAVCLIFMIAEIVSGILANSIAIMTDAAHLLSDLTGFAISVASLYISQLPANARMSYGYHRAEVIGALSSVALIWGLTLWLLSEAVHRLFIPVGVDGQIMLITAMFGFFCNVIMFKVLHSHSHGHTHGHKHKKLEESPDGCTEVAEAQPAKSHVNVNIRAALIHVIGDMIQSIGVIIAATVIYYRPDWSIIDPVCTLMFSVIVVFTTLPIVRDCIEILMEKTPCSINLYQLENDLAAISGVKEVKNLHVWSLSVGSVFLSVHLISDNTTQVLEEATSICKEKYNIMHPTIQTGEKATDQFSDFYNCS